MAKLSNFLRIATPGAIFQSILVGGGFASGREVMEYAGQFGLAGFMVIGLAGGLLFAFMFLAFELARLTQSYDYRTWSRELLGEYWVVFDVLFVIMAVIAIAVVTATVGTTLYVQYQLPYWAATFLIVISVFLLALFGRQWLVRFKVSGSIIFTTVITLIVCQVLYYQESRINIGSHDVARTDWVSSGVIYAGYNFVVIPACVFTVANLRSKTEVIYSCAIGIALTFIPMAVLLFVMVREGSLSSEPLPLLQLVKTYLHPNWLIVYYCVLIYALTDTGIGLTHAITERIGSQLQEHADRTLSSTMAAGVSAIVVLVSLALAQLGIIELISRYYSVMAWGFLAIFALPLLSRSKNIFS